MIWANSRWPLKLRTQPEKKMNSDHMSICGCFTWTIWLKVCLYIVYGIKFEHRLYFINQIVAVGEIWNDWMIHDIFHFCERTIFSIRANSFEIRPSNTKLANEKPFEMSINLEIIRIINKTNWNWFSSWMRVHQINLLYLLFHYSGCVLLHF